MMGQRELGFKTVFTVLFLVCSIISSIIILPQSSRNRRSSYFIQRAAHTLSEQMEIDGKQEFDEEYLRSYFNHLLRVDDPEITQTIFYTGDMSSVGAEYVMMYGNRGKPVYIKFVKDSSFGLKPQKVDESQLWGEGK